MDPGPHESTRLDEVVGRTDDMPMVRGINVFPSWIEGVLVGILRVGDQLRIVIDRKRYELDEVHIRVELMGRGFTGELKDRGVKCGVEDELKAVLDIRRVLELVGRLFRGLLGRGKGRWR